jgi:hypothetical protein
MDQVYGADGDEVTLRVMLEEPGYAPGGAAFTIEYPVEALRLTDAVSHSQGALVSADSLIRWNVAPSQNDYVNQSGSISFVAASALPWPGAEAGGELASFTFKVQPGAAVHPLWEIRLHQGQVPSNDGFEVLELAEATTTFIGQPTTFASWIEPYLDPGQLGDPQFDAPGSDPDGDGVDSLTEYGRGTNPMLPDAGESPRAVLVSDGASEHLAIEFERSLTAIDLAHSVQLSGDLQTWDDADETNSALVLTTPAADGRTETLLVHELSSIEASASRFLRVRFELLELE